MTEHNTVFRGPDTQEAFLADRVRVWDGVSKATFGTVIFMVLLLICMVVFIY